MELHLISKSLLRKASKSLSESKIKHANFFAKTVRASSTSCSTASSASAAYRKESIRAPPTARATDIGILASDIYFPQRFVSQEKLEEFDGVSAGKYTKGLGQERMAFAGPEEDINSMCMSALSQLMDKYGLSPRDIGFLGVGTETLIDKSKSSKTALMSFFESSGNTDIEGVTTINACYGGTASLFHAIDWIESSAYDGRYAIVLCGDIAVYEPGPARPTGGAGVVAMLIGPNAPIVVEPGLRASHFEDVYDFYKPDMSIEYPYVDGVLSNACYIRSIDRCYQRFADKFNAGWGNHEESEPFDLSKADHSLFHLPYTKLVQKSYARYFYNDFQRNGAYTEHLAPFSDISEEESYSHRELGAACVNLSKKDYEQRVYPSTYAGRQLGNLYAGSLYGGLVSLIAHQGDSLIGQRALMFSYGSGSAASMFSLKIKSSVEEQRQACNLIERLESREEATPEEYTATLLEREKNTKQKGAFKFEGLQKHVSPGAFYVSECDDLLRRTYSQNGRITQRDQLTEKKRAVA